MLYYHEFKIYPCRSMGFSSLTEAAVELASEVGSGSIPLNGQTPFGCPPAHGGPVVCGFLCSKQSPVGLLWPCPSHTQGHSTWTDWVGEGEGRHRFSSTDTPTVAAAIGVYSGRPCRRAPHAPYPGALGIIEISFLLTLSKLSATQAPSSGNCLEGPRFFAGWSL